MLIKKISKITRNEKSTIQYLIKKRILKTKKICHKRKKEMSFYLEEKEFRCQKRGHNIKISMFKNSFFENCKVGINRLLLICYLYLHKISTTQIGKMVGVHSESVTYWRLNLREMLADSLDFSDVNIRGPNIIVEVDETKLGKRKFNRGRLVDGVWVIGGIERTPDKKCFLVEVPDRTTETIRNILSLYVLPGSIVYTDCFKAYLPACRDLNLEHQTVNHSIEFKNNENGVCTNTIEGLNNGIKHLIKPRNRSKKNINGWLWYFVCVEKTKKIFGKVF